MTRCLIHRSILLQILIMMFRIILLWVLVLSVCTGCQETDESPVLLDYPMNKGTSWYYSSNSIIHFFENETSDKIIESDTYRLNIRVSIEKDTLMNDSMNVICFASKADEYSFTSKEYFFLDSAGLRAYAYYNPTLHVFAKKGMQGIRSSLLHFPADDEPSLHVYSPGPRLNLKLPLTLNDEWAYTQPVAPVNLGIDKKVLKYEQVMVHGKAYNCFKIRWIYSGNPDFEDMVIHDWVSDEGLVKREVVYSRSLLFEHPYEEFGYGQVTELIELMEFRSVN